MIKQNLLKPAVVSALFLLTSTTALAQSTLDSNDDFSEREANLDKQETKGILGGAIIGGLIAGPPGAIVLAAFGGLIANNNHTLDHNVNLQSRLEDSQERLVALQEQQVALEKQYQLALIEDQNINLLATAYGADDAQVRCCEDSSLEVHFKTNSTDIESHYQQQLQDLSALAKSIPNATIEITGYADRRGNSRENHVLSQNRVNAIEESLLSMGANRRAIQTSAYGETMPLSTTDTLEGNFFDRRVTIQIRSTDTDFVTQNQ